MKRMISIILCALTLLTVTGTGVCAYAKSAEQTYRNYHYVVLKDGTVKITKYSGKEKHVSIPDAINKRNVTVIGANAFEGNRYMQTVDFPKALKKIETDAFRSCEQLKRVEIGGNIEAVGSSAFYFCSNLSDVEMTSKNIRTIGKGAFYITKFYNDSKHWENNALYSGHYLLEISEAAEGEFKIKEGTLGVAEAALHQVLRNGEEVPHKVSGLYIPSSLKYINGNCIESCRSLKSITVDSENPYCSAEDGILFNKAKTRLIAYPAARETEEYTVPETVKSIDEYAFQNARVKTIQLPQGIKKIKSCTFIGSSLTDIEIPKTVTSIAYGAFCNSKLKTVTLHSGIQTIGDKAFSFSALKTVTVPKTVKRIGEEAFYGTPLERAVIKDGIKEIGALAFGSCDKLKTVFVPKSVTKIGTNALGICFSSYYGDDEFYTNPAFVLLGFQGSAAEKYCRNLAKNTDLEPLTFQAVDLSVPKAEITAGKGTIQVRYKKVKNAQGFQVKYTKGRKSCVKTYKTKQSAVRTIKKLKKGSYQVKIRAFYTIDGTRVYSKWTKAKAVKVK